MLIGVFTVSFFGHRRVEDPLRVEQRLETLIRKLLQEKEYVEFLVGRNGEFDQIVSSTIRRCKRAVRDDNSAHVWVLPYITSEYLNNQKAYKDYYDEVEICEKAANSHHKAAFQVRNRNMIERSNLVVFFVEHTSGGAYQSMCYTIKQGVPYINISSIPEVVK